MKSLHPTHQSHLQFVLGALIAVGVLVVFVLSLHAF